MGIYEHMENMSIRGRYSALSPNDLAILSRIPKAKRGDSKALDDLGLRPIHEKSPIEDLVSIMKKQDAIRTRELDLLEKGQLPEDWALFQAWKYEITIGRLELPYALQEKYGRPLTPANYDEWIEGRD